MSEVQRIAWEDVPAGSYVWFRYRPDAEFGGPLHPWALGVKTLGGRLESLYGDSLAHHVQEFSTAEQQPGEFAARDCPRRDPLHYHPTGCPACDDANVITAFFGDARGDERAAWRDEMTRRYRGLRDGLERLEEQATGEIDKMLSLAQQHPEARRELTAAVTTLREMRAAMAALRKGDGDAGISAMTNP